NCQCVCDFLQFTNSMLRLVARSPCPLCRGELRSRSRPASTPARETSMSSNDPSVRLVEVGREAAQFERKPGTARTNKDTPARHAPAPWKSHRTLERPPCPCIALVLQGGGALGAFQAGVYQALAEANLQPDWVSGISIGAINAALIAGNAPQARLEKLHAFWDQVSAPYVPD